MEDKIIMVEDDCVLLQLVCAELKSSGYHVKSCGTISECKEFLKNEECTQFLYIFDVNLPDGNGFELCRHIRSQGKTIPILMLTVLEGEDEIVEGLESGADDYMVKPFSMKVLKSRIKALLRRYSPNYSDVIRSADLRIDFPHLEVLREGVRLNLLPKELEIMKLLLIGGGSLISRRAMLERIWDVDGDFIDDNTLSVHVSRLRKKLGSYQGEPYIITERGFGYRWGVKIEKN